MGKHTVVVRFDGETKNFSETPENLKSLDNVGLKKMIAKLYGSRFEWDAIIVVCYGHELSTEDKAKHSTQTLKSLMADKEFGKKIASRHSIMINIALASNGG